MFSKLFFILAPLTATTVLHGGVSAFPALDVRSLMGDTVQLDARATAAAPTITLCTSREFLGTCLSPSVVSDTCIDLTGGMTILNKELSSAIIPAGFVCTFFTQFGCTTVAESDSQDQLGLVGGSYPDFSSITGVDVVQDFEDVPSSYSCSPL
ncbi:hypothetical protein VKT23_019812 [Stygiomarasmius scandens]|uniref:Uncharacterized protein n=1 Tax=Marasmiellus scandens TaxID=2682957 RepID=A0ABR1IKC9_9AGAR